MSEQTLDGPLPPEFVPSLRTDYLRRDLDGQAVVWSPDRSCPSSLDPAATVMLEVLDGDASIAQLAREVSDEVGVPVDTALGQVSRIVHLFAVAGLLDEIIAPGEDAQQAINCRKLADGPLSH